MRNDNPDVERFWLTEIPTLHRQEYAARSKLSRGVLALPWNLSLNLPRNPS
ncbi:hypothetical protein KPSA1_00745 [Pseudomonas syringae pv. actinidiae]|uniref:Uncharacterized protein n=1 Tax=Pseudomonas syringae pv. actinidiae TaxID=103796 RepID=A0A2V0QE05_PSESF|nr:hypothetical protein KPSA1_00745 [Pseudomonas syringae pv. actinidiae]